MDAKATLTSSLVTKPSLSASAEVKNSETSCSVALLGTTFVGSLGGVTGSVGFVSSGT